jgi:hypothetical protein
LISGVLRTEVVVGPDCGSGAHSGRVSVTVARGNDQVDTSGTCGRALIGCSREPDPWRMVRTTTCLGLELGLDALHGHNGELSTWSSINRTWPTLAHSLGHFDH